MPNGKETRGRETAPEPGTVIRMSELPKCDICGGEAHYDAKTVSGQWGYLCNFHYLTTAMYGTLGVGMGQKLVLSN